jgi:beta-glucosidase
MYLGFPDNSGEPPKQLKGFKKVSLAPGQKQTINFNLKDRDLSIWDAKDHKWQLQKGTFQIMIGSSSRDIRAV